MPQDAHLDRVIALREQGYAPRQIARALGIRPAEAARLVRVAAAGTRSETAEPPLVGCWISPTWNAGLTIGDHPDWPMFDGDSAETGGLASVLVARRHRHDKVSVCGYLADVYCLGVKNVYGPTIMDELGLRGFIGVFFAAYPDEPLAVPIELARDVVLGSVAYARGLGFDPHSDFAAAQGHLGAWTPPGSISFGKDGKPCYVSGPRDNPQRIVRTLERTVGAGNYDYVAVAG